MSYCLSKSFLKKVIKPFPLLFNHPWYVRFFRCTFGNMHVFISNSSCFYFFCNVTVYQCIKDLLYSYQKFCHICFLFLLFTLQEWCCRSRALCVTLQRESEIACICICWRFCVFWSQQNLIFFRFGPVRFYLLHVQILITPIKWSNVSRRCSRYKTSSKLCSFSATDCPISNVD